MCFGCESGHKTPPCPHSRATHVHPSAIRDCATAHPTRCWIRLFADNAVSIAQAHFSDVFANAKLTPPILNTTRFRAIYADETPVGFLMLSDDPEKERYFLWRFMIAGPHQKKGFGRQAFDRLVDYVKTRPGAKELQVSYGQGAGGPEGFYLKYGLVPNGETYGREVGATLVW